MYGACAVMYDKYVIYLIGPVCTFFILKRIKSGNTQKSGKKSQKEKKRSWPPTLSTHPATKEGVIQYRHSVVGMPLQNCFPQVSPPLLRAPKQSWVTRTSWMDHHRVRTGHLWNSRVNFSGVSSEGYWSLPLLWPQQPGNLCLICVYIQYIQITTVRVILHHFTREIFLFLLHSYHQFKSYTEHSQHNAPWTLINWSLRKVAIIMGKFSDLYFVPLKKSGYLSTHLLSQGLTPYVSVYRFIISTLLFFHSTSH